MDSPIARHFGRAPRFIVVDTETGDFETVQNQGHHHGGSSPPPEDLAAAGVDVVLAGDIGRGAVTRFEARRIEVFRGASGSVRESIEAWNAGDLERVGPEDVHDHGSGHDHAGEGHSHDHG